MKLIVGLGNPGAKHAKERHNIGFMLADMLASDNHFPAWKTKFSGQISDGRIGTQKCLLLKPDTFMNRSGQSVGEAVRFYDIAPEDVIVLHDELDLNFAKLRIKFGGGHGGHNGLRDIDNHIGKDYWRIRLGIDHPGDKNRVTGYVLSNFAKTETEALPHWLGLISHHFPMLFDQGAGAFMTKIALETQE